MLMLLAASVLSGCHQPLRPLEPTSQDIALTGEGEYEALLDTCLDVLRDYRFKLDRVDRRLGVITTLPTTSQQVFEFWRDDVNTTYDLMEATLLTIRRRVEIQLHGEGDPSRRTLVVNVYREKFSTPDRQYNTSSAAFRVFSRTLPSTEGETIVPERDNVWFPAGRDGMLERRLIEEITGRLYVGGPDSPA